jgi:SH3 domain-containing YSC84-like protein 1
VEDHANAFRRSHFSAHPGPIFDSVNLPGFYDQATQYHLCSPEFAKNHLIHLIRSRMNFLAKRTTLVLISFLSLGVSTVTLGQEDRNRSTKKSREAAEQSSKAARVFNEIMGTREKSIPQDLLDKAEAVAVFPGVLKGGFIVGGRGGSGVISRRVPGGWSAPAFFDLGGGSIGLQIGVASTDYILLFMNAHAVDSLLSDKFEIGGEGSAAAGPVGRSASASTDLKLNAQILSYSRSKGAFAGLELKGVVIKPDNDDNVQVYGISARDILTGANKIKLADMPEGVRVFPETLGRYSKRK